MKNMRVYMVMCLALYALITVYTAGLRPLVVAPQFVFTADAFAHIISAWQAQGLLHIYVNHFYFDYVFLLLYGAIGYYYVIHKYPLAPGYVKWLIPLAAAFDVLENSMQLYLLNAITAAGPAWYALAGTFSSAKFLCILLFGWVLLRHRPKAAKI